VTDEKPDYAAIIKSRKPLPTLDLDDLRRRSAEATKATLVLQPASDAPDEAKNQGADPDPASLIGSASGKPSARKAEAPSPDSARVPLRFSVSPGQQHELRIQAALENKSVPDLMREIIAAYLRKQGRKP
jgi:hypothetical protein